MGIGNITQILGGSSEWHDPEFKPINKLGLILIHGVVWMEFVHLLRWHGCSLGISHIAKICQLKDF